MAKRKPITVIMEDPLVHTVNQPICQEPSCICRDLEYLQLLEDVKKPSIQHKMHKILVERNYETAPLNYRNRGFQLLK